MDASNPILTGEQVNFEKFRHEQLLLVRQDFKKLKEIVEKGERKPAPNFGTTYTEPDKNKIRELVNSSMTQQEGEWSLGFLEDVSEGCLVEEEYSPRGRFQKGPYICVNRQFSRFKRYPEFLDVLLGVEPLFEQKIEKLCYTGGTIEGFQNRLKMWARRDRRDLKESLSEWALSPGDLFELFPYDSELLPDWNQTISDLLSNIKITRTSGGGPPFFQPKYLCFPKILAALDQIVESITRGDIDEFLKEHHSFLLAECKNKADRYEVEKLNRKTRPYFSFSAPIQLLFSTICQPFCTALKTFDIDPSSANAYGFSWAHGGGDRLWHWIRGVEEGGIRFMAYGDDAKIVWRKGGILWEVNPDVEQMDGSVDSGTAELTVEMVRRAYEGKFGKNDFFTSLCALWRRLAVAGEFLVTGTKVYTSKNGLRSGVVGTTLFDTVKLVGSLMVLKQAKLDLSKSGVACKFLRETCGLVIKEGTWEPSPVGEDPGLGEVISDQKWLGCLLVMVEGAHRMEPLPFLPEDDLVSLIGNVRQQVVLDRTARQRRVFDTARGYQVTAAFHHPRIWDALSMVLDRTPPDVVCMRVQSNSGTGEQPELIHLVGDDFAWPSSDGYPTVDFCRDVYLSPENKLGGEWVYCIPSLVSPLKEFRKVVKNIDPAKTETKNWAREVATEELVRDVEEVKDPTVPGGLDTRPLGAFKIPKGYIKFKPVKDDATKQQVLDRRLEGVDMVHHQAVGLLMPFGDYWITENLLKKRWQPTQDGWWVAAGESLEDKEPLSEVTKAWSYDARRALAEAHFETESPKMKELEEMPNKGVIVIEENFEDLLEVPREKWPKDDLDPVSFVTYLFVTRGTKLESTNTVLSQTPNPLVRHSVKRVDQNVEVGESVEASKVIARKLLFEQIKKWLIEHK